MALTDLARRLEIAVSTVILAVERGAKLMDCKKLTLAAVSNMKKQRAFTHPGGETNYLAPDIH